MKPTHFIFFLLLSLFSCKRDNSETSKAEATVTFNETNWKIKEGEDYSYREKMLDSVVYNDTIRSLNKNEILQLLGKPDRINKNHFYYTIAQKRIGLWPLHTKTMVIKFVNDSKIEWIKIME